MDTFYEADRGDIAVVEAVKMLYFVSFVSVRGKPCLRGDVREVRLWQVVSAFQYLSGSLNGCVTASILLSFPSIVGTKEVNKIRPVFHNTGDYGLMGTAYRNYQIRFHFYSPYAALVLLNL